MKQIIFLAFLLPCILFGKNIFTARIADNSTNEPIPGVTVIIKNTTLGNISDANGNVIIEKIPDGTFTIVFSHLGYKAEERVFTFPLLTKNIVVALEEESEELEEVIISTTRTSRNIETAPTRVESMPLEEIEEKNTMRVNNVSMILHEATGIQMQQTSYASGAQSIRIQGLDGKYTQLLKDGFPAFSGFSSGMSVMDIPPLDLNQVEVIKGPTSTLYGGGAIAGVVNFISKTPKNEPELNILLNRTSAGGNDIGAFGMTRNESYGFSALATAHLQDYYDVNNDHFTELPKTKEFNFNPTLFFYKDDTPFLKISNTSSLQNRHGGDVSAIEGNVDTAHHYSEKNISFRNNTYIQFENEIESIGTLIVKQLYGYYDKELTVLDYLFKGEQHSAYSEISLIHNIDAHAIVIGSNFSFEQFNEKQDSSIFRRDYHQKIFGLYAQDTWDISERFVAESGLRFDYSASNEFFILPRISLLTKFNDKFSSRIGGGLGYKLATIFSEESEVLAFQNILPIASPVKAERSFGGTFDINYKEIFFNTISFSLNQMFFFTQINKPLVLKQNTLNQFHFENANEPIRSMGFETNIKLVYNVAKLLLGYTFTEAKELYRMGNQIVPLLPVSRLNIILIFEEERNYKAGIEAYFTDTQFLSNGTKTPSFWDMGIFLEKTFGAFSIFLNGENITDTRQSKFSQVVFPPHNNPVFEEVYTSHIEGFVMNGGIRIRF